MAAMNASATPFVPEAQSGEDPLPIQGANEATGVEVETGGMSGVSVWRPQYKGRVRSFSDQKGFGFIDCPETLRAFGRDVFIHRFQFAECGLKVGNEVIFEVELNKMGHPQARRVRINEEAASNWDMSSGMGGYNSGGMHYGMQGAYGGGMDGGMYYGYMGGHDSSYGGDSRMMNRGMRGQETELEESSQNDLEKSLRACSGSQAMWEIIEKSGHAFGKRHVITALYQLGLCRQYERRTAQAPLTSALVDRLVIIPPGDLTAEESVRVLWAMAMLEEVRESASAHRFVMALGEEATKRCHEFSPPQMASFVNSLSRLVLTNEEDELVGKVTTGFSDYALGGGTGALPRFPPDELAIWTKFLQDAAQQHSTGQSPQPNQQPPGAYPWGKGGMPGYGPPGGGAYGAQPGMGPPWPQNAPPQAMGKGFPGMYPPGKGGKPGPMPEGFGGKPGFPPEGFGGKPGYPGMYGPPGSAGCKGKPGGPPDGPGGMSAKGVGPGPGKSQPPAGFGGPSAGSDSRMGGGGPSKGGPQSMGMPCGKGGPPGPQGGKPSMPPGPVNMPPGYSSFPPGGQRGPPGGAPGGPRGGMPPDGGGPPGGKGPMGPPSGKGASQGGNVLQLSC